MRLVPLAAEVLKALVRELKPREVAVSSYGIREGLLYEQMSETLRHRDPLIEAARHSEALLGPDAGVRACALPFRRAAVSAREVREAAADPGGVPAA
jgi:exopolyphosphatase/pppGpp-phosphohydrolase